MSAWIVDPRTIDYLVQWAHRHRHDHGNIRTERIVGTFDGIPDELQQAATVYTQGGFILNLQQIMPNDLGAVLMRENVRSVQQPLQPCRP